MSAHQIVDLFAGPGGLDVAARWLGVPVTGVELDPNACATRKAAGLDTKQDDVCELNPSHFPGATVLAGGPPCQTYTVAGDGDGRRALQWILSSTKSMAKKSFEDVVAGIPGKKVDPRTLLVLQPLRWALMAMKKKPYDVIVLEQVQTVLPVWEAMAEVLHEKGYNVDFGILRAEQFGVPQTRRRAVLIARLDGPARLPEATHRCYRKGTSREEGDQSLDPWVSMGDVLVERAKPFEVISNYGTGGDPKARGRRRHDQPAFTVTGKIRRNRVVTLGLPDSRFSHAEAGQLQSFPMDYQWRGSDVAQQIGNAIPPVLAIHILAAALGIGKDGLVNALRQAASQCATMYPSERVLSKLGGGIPVVSRGAVMEEIFSPV
ncbi:DNA cytosine methyltransferase [Streptomyces sp. HK10]|uniref:DNA cytosine methyltransferase n=1 Tax=Streptomyces sp. HK10 TaxID=3373255 RepID=UPI003747D267